jgi:hypothetical protein
MPVYSDTSTAVKEGRVAPSRLSERQMARALSRGVLNHGQRATVTLPDGRSAIFTKGHSATYNTLVMVDARKLDRDWAQDPHSLHNAGNEIQGRKENFTSFLNARSGTAQTIEAPKVSLGRDGQPSFTDGRHRFSVLRDMGVARVALAIPRKELPLFKAKYGARLAE